MSSLLNRIRTGNAGSVGTTATSARVILASESQRNFYETICAQRRIEPVANYKELASKELSKLIEETKLLPTWVEISAKQLEVIEDLADWVNMPQLIIRAKGLSTREASQMIEDLKFLSQSMPSRKQVELVEKMALCPDVNPLELMDGKIQEAVDELIHLRDELVCILSSEEIDLQNKELKMTHDQIKAKYAKQKETNYECQKAVEKVIADYESSFSYRTVSKADISEFIQKYQMAYGAWLRTRASEAQRKLIVTLGEKNGVEFKESELIQLSFEDAGKVINQLQVGTYVKADYDKRENWQIEHSDEDEREKLEKLAFSLASIAGISTDDVDYMIKQTNFEEQLEELIVLARLTDPTATEAITSAI